MEAGLDLANLDSMMPLILFSRPPEDSLNLTLVSWMEIMTTEDLDSLRKFFNLILFMTLKMEMRLLDYIMIELSN